nr:PEP-CTERM sorting domain-containing protein [Arenibaculum pallidiluteum]
MKLSTLKLTLAAAAMLAATSGAASAAPYITGGFGFTGRGDTGTTKFENATRIDFGYANEDLLPDTYQDAGNGYGLDGTFRVNIVSGSFNGLMNYKGWIKDIDLTTANAGVDNFLSVGGFTFDLTSLQVLAHDALTLTIGGTGILSGAGYEDTSGSFRISLNNIPDEYEGNSTRRFDFTFSGITGAVPEPGTLALLGAGLAGFAAVRRRKA